MLVWAGYFVLLAMNLVLGFAMFGLWYPLIIAGFIGFLYCVHLAISYHQRGI